MADSLSDARVSCPFSTDMVQALLDEWRAELSRKPLGMTEADACSVLGIESEASEQVSKALQIYLLV